MSATMTVEEAQAKLKELIHQMMPGDEIILTEIQQRVAKLVSAIPKAKPGLRPPPGLGKGIITILSDDEEHLKDFVEYRHCKAPPRWDSGHGERVHALSSLGFHQGNSWRNESVCSIRRPAPHLHGHGG